MESWSLPAYIYGDYLVGRWSAWPLVVKREARKSEEEPDSWNGDISNWMGNGMMGLTSTSLRFKTILFANVATQVLAPTTPSNIFQDSQYLRIHPYGSRSDENN